MSDKLIPNQQDNNEISCDATVNNLNIENMAVLKRFASLCVKTQKTITDLNDSIRQMKEFHKGKLENGDVNYSSGKSRIDAIENLENMEKKTSDAASLLQKLLNEAYGQMPIVGKTAGITLGMSGSASDDENEDEG